ncbi:MAG TPA: response regulator, partial [Magnetospirillum sp.]|nr:response regulator [Magnetospirillum sp.]
SRVLLADDDPETGDVVAEALRRRGWMVTQCNGAAEALRTLAEDSHFDVVLSDQIMPDTRGTDLVRTIRRRHPQLPCVLYTGYDESLNDRTARECGASTLLNKPLDFDALSDTLARHARRRESGDTA